MFFALARSKKELKGIESHATGGVAKWFGMKGHPGVAASDSSREDRDLGRRQPDLGVAASADQPRTKGVRG